jgi:regulatory protein YycI of two-component signal transduction system YycFG
MKFTTSEGTYRIRFQHIPSFSRRQRRKTICLILNKDNNVIAAGEAQCSRKDVYLKEEGRLISLRRALEIGTVNQELRGAAWKAYRNRKTTQKVQTPVISSPIGIAA